MTKEIDVRGIKIGGDNPLAFILGPCVIESEKQAMEHAEMISRIAEASSVKVIYKSSYDKANRSSISSYRGPGIKEGLRILEKIRAEFDLPILTDVHSAEEAKQVGEVLDVIQIPAFLCRQTDILMAAAKTGKVINVKKGQFLSPPEMGNIVDKISSTGNDRILMTERGTTFGYNNLVVDMRGIPIMQSMGYPVVFDATHSVQLPGGKGDSSGGDRRFVSVLAKSAAAAGCDAIFMEVHKDPDNAPCDGPNMVPLDQLKEIIDVTVAIRELVKQ